MQILGRPSHKHTSTHATRISGACAHTHTRARAHTHTLTHTHTHAHAHTHTRTHTHTYTHTLQALSGDVKVYNFTGGKALPDWVPERKRRQLLKKDIDLQVA